LVPGFKLSRPRGNGTPTTATSGTPGIIDFVPGGRYQTFSVFVAGKISGCDK
jgi:hypothetical protein